ncbi:MAG: response regulator [Gallionella sp.]|nr:response regulator [Gallionella sp.]
MNTLTPTAATILIATDNVTDAALVEKLLHPEFDHIFMSTDPDKLPGDFVRHRPSVLILAFNTLEKSERYYLGLYRLCETVHQYPHRTVILCNKDEVKPAYELCKKDYFDDYILFWPMTYDMSRLAMTIHHALHELAVLNADGTSAAEFAAQVRRLAELEKILTKQVAQGGQHIEAVSRVIEQSGQKIGMAMDEFFHRLISGAFPDLIEVKNADGLGQEISRFKREEIQQNLSAAAESTQPMEQWAQEFRLECEPLLESVRALNAMAERIRPTVLVVDDDEPQRKIIGKLLRADNYHLIYANNGFEALNILRRTQPDLILMDMMMPDMNGLEATRRLKANPRFYKTPVIMITGKSEGKIVADSMKAGAVDFVVKPFDHATLMAKIDHALSAEVPLWHLVQ